MDQYQQQHIAGLMAGMGLLFGLIILVFVIFFIFLFWRIFNKAGLAGPLALLILVPGVGSLIVLCILAFAQWKVAPIAVAPYYPPAYPPPPPGYPPPPPAPPTA